MTVLCKISYFQKSCFEIRFFKTDFKVASGLGFRFLKIDQVYSTFQKVLPIKYYLRETCINVNFLNGVSSCYFSWRYSYKYVNSNSIIKVQWMFILECCKQLFLHSWTYYYIDLIFLNIAVSRGHGTQLVKFVLYAYGDWNLWIYYVLLYSDG